QTELIQEKGTAPGFVVYLPIYTNGLSHDTVEERQKRLEGYVAAIFRIGDVIAQSLKGVDQNGLRLRFLDQNAASTNQILFQNTRERAKPAVLQMETSIEMAGRKWSLESALSPEYLLAHRAWQSWSVPAVALLFTGLLGAFLLVVTGHRQRDEVLVAERTHELVAANAMLHREIAERSVAENGLRVSEAKLRSVTHSIGDAIVSADDSGNIVFWNPGAEAIFGYNESEAIGKPLHTIIPERYHKDSSIQKTEGAARQPHHPRDRATPQHERWQHAAAQKHGKDKPGERKERQAQSEELDAPQRRAHLREPARLDDHPTASHPH